MEKYVVPELTEETIKEICQFEHPKFMLQQLNARMNLTAKYDLIFHIVINMSDNPSVDHIILAMTLYGFIGRLSDRLHLDRREKIVKFSLRIGAVLFFKEFCKRIPDRTFTVMRQKNMKLEFSNKMK
jgi:hypothetical protein